MPYDFEIMHDENGNGHRSNRILPDRPNSGIDGSIPAVAMKHDHALATTGKSTSRSHDDHGFTLFELLIALTLVALLVSIIVPGAHRLLDRELVNTAERVIVDLRQQRLRALRHGDNVMVDLQGYLDGVDALELRPISGGSLVEFMPDGRSSGGSFELSDGRRSIAIAVDPLTGEIEKNDDG